MKRTIFPLLAAIFAACASQPATPPAHPSLPAPPVTETKPVTEVLHGVELTDPYRWLEDQNSPETRAWIDRENAYTDQVLAHLPQKAAFAERMLALQNSDKYQDLPIYRGGRAFYEKRKAGSDLYSIYMRDGLSGPEVLLIDPAPMSAKHTTNVGIEDVAADGKLLAYHVRQGGADEVEVHFYDVDARHDVGAVMPKYRYEGIAVTPDHRTVYYARSTDAGTRVFRRAVDGGEETKLFGDGYTPENIVTASLSEDGHYLIILVYHGSAGTKTDVFLQDLAASGPIQTVVNDLDARTLVDVAGDTLVIQTNWNAPNDRVMTVSAANPGRANWKEIVPQSPTAAIQGVTASGGKIFVRYLENVKPVVGIFDLDGKRAGEIQFDTIGDVNDVRGTWSSPVAFYRFNSFALPSTIYAYDVAAAKRSTFAQETAPVDPSNFVVDQVWYASKDGTRVPMFLFYKRGLEKNGKNAVYLTGYGGFNVSEVPTFSPRAIAWAEAGGIYALPNLRGGGEFGEPWHRAGMLDRKQNTFDDFIAAGEYLIREHYTSSAHLGIAGGSNGGLLVTAAATQRPDLMKAVICSYPLIDMIRYHKFLVGAFWVPEYGSADDPEQFRWIYPYSPYQHVVKGTKYPAILFVTGDADTRVAPLHARKMAALMQASTGSSNPILIRYHTAGGHSGGEPLNVAVGYEAESLAFLWSQVK